MSSAAAALRGTHVENRTLIALAVALPVTLWLASQIEMNLFMAFVIWVLIAVRTIFHENRTVVRATIVALLVWAIVLPFFQESGGGFIEDATLALAYAVFALGLNIIVGFAGLLDLGYVAFFALGALTAGWFMSGFFSSAGGGEGFSLLVGEPASTLPGIHVNFLMVIVIAIVITTIAGMLIGLPTLRLRGDYIAIVTLAFGEIIGRLVINGDELVIRGEKLTNGRQGITPIDKIDLPVPRAIHSRSSSDPGTSWRSALVFVALFVNYRLRDSRLGRAWIALREDEVAAASMGVPLVKTKLLAYGTGAAFGGMAGAFIASYLNTVNADQFAFSFSIFVLAMVILGGLGSIEGVVLGAIVLSFINNNLIPDVFNDYPSKIGLDFDLTELSFGIFGFLLVIMMVLRPEGLHPRAKTARSSSPRASAPATPSWDVRGPVRGARMNDSATAPVPSSDGGLAGPPLLTHRERHEGLRRTRRGRGRHVPDPASGRSSRSSARTAPARPRSSTCSPASTGRPTGAITVRRQERHRAAARPDHEGRRGAHVPEHPPVRHDDRDRERDGRPARSHEGGPVRLDPPRFRWVRREEKAVEREGARDAHLRRAFPRASIEQMSVNLSYGDQRRLEIARALASDPKLLLLDEPTAGMNPQESADLTGFMRRLRDERDLTILLIEHDMQVVMGVSERITVLDHGQKIAEGTPEEVRKNARVVEAYLGKQGEKEAEAGATRREDGGREG